MISFVQFALLGLGAGAVYTLLAQGVVLIYRASGIVNFAHAAFAMVGAYLFYELTLLKMAIPLALVLTVVVTAVLGLLTYVLVIRPLRKASPLARTISTLGILGIFTPIGVMRYQEKLVQAKRILPSNAQFFGDVVVPQDRLWLSGIAILFTIALTLVYTRTQFGRATSAVAENEVSAAALGWSPDRLASINWAVSTGLAGLAGILIAPLAGLTVEGITLMIVPALAAAVLGGFNSFWLTLAGGFLTGMLQSLTGRYITEIGWPQAVPFLLVTLVLVIGGKSLPLRSHFTGRLPELGTGRIRWGQLAIGLALLGVWIAVVPNNWVVNTIVTLAWGIILLSVVVLTGFAGQLSLAQFALAGVGALLAARLIGEGLPFELAFLLSIVATVIIGVVIGLPAVRTRGVNLAVVTLGLGAAVDAVFFHSPKYMGTPSGSPIGVPTFFGISIDGIFHPRIYAVFALAVLVLLVIVVSNMRRGVTGRRLIAVRTNERAAAALGISVARTKLFAFGLAAGIAAAGGIVYSFRAYTVTYNGFSTIASITIVSMAVVGGVGYLLGVPYGALLAVGGVGSIITDAIFGDGKEQIILLVGGVALIVILILNPDGMAKQMAHDFKRLTKRFGHERKHTEPGVDLTVAAATRLTPRVLKVSDVTVTFGGVRALDGVSLEVHPGKVVGLIGPNGAGKTTLIDGVTGFVKPASGTITLAGQQIEKWPAHRRNRAGISRSFQSLELFDDISVLENIRAASDPRSSLAWFKELVKPTNEPLTPVARAAIRIFELGDVLDRRPSELPYGTRRLVAIARALAAGPSVLMLDEPAAGLDENESHELARLVRQLADEWGIAVLVIEHDMAFVMSICDEITVLDFGFTIAHGTPAQVRADPRVRAAYLGEAIEEDAITVSAPQG